jgi:hypothetical protein
VSAKKSAKSKEKTSHPAETAASTRKPSAEAKEPKPIMDSRSGKERRQNDRRYAHASVEVERRSTQRREKVSRRRQIDPTTCERDYSAEEVEFMSALDDYKRRSGRMFPTCSEVLEVIRGLGYEKRTDPPTVALPVESLSIVAATAEQAV